MLVDNFWQKLKRPIIGLAPMDGVTDAAFRAITLKYGRPDVMFTEFVAVDGINAGVARVLDAFIFGNRVPNLGTRFPSNLAGGHVPIVAQVFGGNPDNFYKSAAVVCALGFDGFDINMGCPDKDVVRLHGGASLIDRPDEAKAIVAAAKRGINDFTNGRELMDFNLPENIIARIKEINLAADRKIVRRAIPLSVKTRIGTQTNTAKEWAKHLGEMELANITFHGRTLKQAYSGAADWDSIAAAAKIAGQSGASVLGNGDIKTRADAEARAAKYGLDGVLIGRAAFGNPWVFGNSVTTVKERLQVAVEHAVLYEKFFPGKHFVEMRKHLAWYAHGFEGASGLRAKLVYTKNAAEAVKIIHEFSLPLLAQHL